MTGKSDSAERTIAPRATLLHIAERAGVSRATVSLVMRESPAVAAVTRQSVLEAADQLGYVYNRAASSLRSQRSASVGVLVTTVGNPFFAELTAGVESVLSATGRLVLLGQHSEDLAAQERWLNRMLEYRVDGVILTAASGTSGSMIERLTSRGVSVVLCTRRVDTDLASYVGSDNEAGARKAVEHLIGFHNVASLAFVGGRESGSPRVERSRGMSAAIDHVGFDQRNVLSIPTPPTREAAYEATVSILAKHSGGPLGIFAYNDLVAFGVAAAVRDASLEVGSDVLLVGFDDVSASRHEHAPLSTIAVNASGLGALAAETLVHMIDESSGVVEVVRENELIVRSSCGCTEGSVPPSHRRLS
jgi:LacI family transcriptional regulator